MLPLDRSDVKSVLSIDASLDGLGAVLSQIPAGERKARPIAFAKRYSHLFAEAECVSHDGIQDTFRLKVQCHRVKQSVCGVEYLSDPLKCPCDPVSINEAVGKAQNGVLYRVVKDHISKQKRHQYVLPDSLKDKALHAYHPMGNGGTERFNGTLGNMLRSLPLRDKNNWPQQVQTLTFAYNATVHETTGYAPFQLMFCPRLPVDVMFRQVLHDPVVVDYKSYAKTLMSHLHEAARIAQQHAFMEQDKQAKGYNRKVKGTYLNIGDRVLIANKGERGMKKLADKWNATMYTVKERNLQTHTYKLEDNAGNTKVEHRNLVLDISFLPVVTTEEERSSVRTPNGQHLFAAAYMVVLPKLTTRVLQSIIWLHVRQTNDSDSDDLENETMQVTGFFRQFVEEASADSLRELMRFWVGWEVPCKNLKLEEVQSTGPRHLPNSSTCNECLRLPNHYTSYAALKADMILCLRSVESGFVLVLGTCSMP
ncbi:hypothetical protein F2P81_011920 [Scophthalmus maximus]|uniref:Integrase catalytic domain-containing protein n=1 Tax=Scophthalmus maximus TaxID=52904 RepID=A0A6A4SWX8_SCOMX|nr:hypothetical protein F2P81_011920 [Scophthalmus maximus]